MKSVLREIIKIMICESFLKPTSRLAQIMTQNSFLVLSAESNEVVKVLPFEDEKILRQDDSSLRVTLFMVLEFYQSYKSQVATDLLIEDANALCGLIETFLYRRSKNLMTISCNSKEMFEKFGSNDPRFFTIASDIDSVGACKRQLEPDRVYRRRFSSYSAARVTVFRLS